MGKMKSLWEQIPNSSIDDYLYIMYIEEQKQKKEKSSETNIRKVSTRRRVDVKNKR